MACKVKKDDKNGEEKLKWKNFIQWKGPISMPYKMKREKKNPIFFTLISESLK